MDIQVVEGRLTEAPHDGATGVERRAFGEFVGPRGELASYAFGWCTGSEQQSAALTIGMGIGNPGGGTFHARIFPHDGGYASSLVDEPFEQVPEGGPDLSAEEARAHDTLPFIWWVADLVMERDRRAWWMKHWLLGTMAVQTPEVHGLREPVLLVVHDDDDEEVTWHLVGATGAGDDGTVAHLHHAIERDPALLDVMDLAPGEHATRDHEGAPWKRS
ncbi:hypothetical protein [Symbioplanes lichenis]|uniref:hypothetical protein n=1 Tax=Symbioplanes lichenis TaxID=1629072 RepID=UPI00273A0C83|nr:hypothetical protein [Actinoplanes lichenis]